MMSSMRASVRTRRKHQRGFSLMELLIVIAIILIILTIALPHFSKAQQNAREMGAVATIRTINSMETQYMSQFGHYASSLAQLGPPAGAGAAEGPEAAGLIPGSLAGGTTGGYKYAVTQTPTGYAISAVPSQFGTTGRRTFYSDQSGVVRENWGADPATAQSPEAGK